jgi:hypothetical protein
MAGIVFTFGGGADLESRRRNDAPVMAASAPTQNLATKETATPVAEERRDAVSPMPVENVTSAKADLNTETASAAAPLASTAQAPVQSPIIPTVVQGMTSQLTSPRSEPVPQAPPVASSNAIPQTKQPAASEANAALMQQALGPKSNTVVISTRDLQAQPQQEESLGDVARRYQEQKRLKGDN